MKRNKAFNIYKILTLCFFFFALSQIQLTAQNARTISGIVIDQDGEAIIGAVVGVEGTTKGTITDIEGKFEINTEIGSVLKVSYVGYKTTTIKVASPGYLKIVLENTAIEVGEVVVVGYSAVKKESLTGAVSNITSKDIISTKSPSLAVSLAGKVAGLNIRQTSGAPGTFATDINIRGMGTPLFIIDGIVRDGATEFQRLNPEDIESISFLKDGTAAIYGMNSSNGAIIVTTKKGKNDGKTTISLSSNIGFTSRTDVPQMSNAAQWVEMMNDAQVNIGATPFVTREELQKWRSGAEGYKSYDYYDEIFRKVATQQQHTLSFQGGSDKISFFGSLGVVNDNGLARSNSINYNQFSLRSNVTAKISKNLSAELGFYGITGTRNQGGIPFEEYYFISLVEPPKTSLYANNNKGYYNDMVYGANPLASSQKDLSGYDKYTNRNIQTTLALNYDVPSVKGLKLRLQGGYDYNTNIIKVLRKEFNTYSYTYNNSSSEYVYTPHTYKSPSSILNQYADNDRLNIQAMAMYKNTFNTVHDIAATFVVESKAVTVNSLQGNRNYDFYTIDDINFGRTSDMQNAGWSRQERNMSYIGRLNYGLMNKYLLELAFRYDGSYRYEPDNRWGFFPMGSIGWRVSEEDFMKKNFSFVDNLKLRASMGVSGEDAGEAFQYVSGYTLNSGGFSFTPGEFTSGLGTPILVNKDLTWFRTKIYDIGVDFGLWNNLFFGEFDVFQRDRTGLLTKRNLSLPNTFGADLPQENLNSDRTLGLEFTLGHSNRIGDFNYTIKGNMTFARTKNVYVEEGTYQSSWDRWRNQSSDRYQNFVWGYQSNGQFQNQEQLSTAPIQNGSLGNGRELPGDFMYVDVNGDGVINERDMMPNYWGSSPLLYYGFTLNASWKGFDFNMLLQGAGLYTVKYMDVYSNILYQGGNTPEYFYDRWHLADPYDATSGWVAGKWPATRTDKNMGALYYDSDVWRKDATYLRVKSVELGYTLDPKLVKKWGLENARVYVNGNNLWTFCNSFVKSFDPEKYDGKTYANSNDNKASRQGITYPLTKCISFGFNLTF